MICVRCGLVLDDRPTYAGSEGFPSDGYTPRYSGAYTNRVHDHGVGGTEIGGASSKRNRLAYRQLDILVDPKNKKLKRALTYLNELIRVLKPPTSVQETAAKLVRQAISGKNFKESTSRRVVIASLYLAYKLSGIPVSPKKFSSELGISLSDLWEGVRKIRESSDVKVDPEKYDPRPYVSVIVNKLGLPPIVEYYANKILSLIKEEGFVSGKSPASLAAASVYLAGIVTNNKRNQLDIGQVLGLTDVAIRNAYNAILQEVDIDVLL